jgi:hypothetical protein
MSSETITPSNPIWFRNRSITTGENTASRSASIFV